MQHSRCSHASRHSASSGKAASELVTKRTHLSRSAGAQTRSAAMGRLHVRPLADRSATPHPRGGNVKKGLPYPRGLWGRCSSSCGWACAALTPSLLLPGRRLLRSSFPHAGTLEKPAQKSRRVWTRRSLLSQGCSVPALASSADGIFSFPAVPTSSPSAAFLQKARYLSMLLSSLSKVRGCYMQTPTTSATQPTQMATGDTNSTPAAEAQLHATALHAVQPPWG